MDRRMINAINGGAIVNMKPKIAKNLIANMATKS